MSNLVTPIPPQAEEVLHETWETGGKKSASYVLNTQRVGYRAWSETGQLIMDYALHDERMHGLFRTWHENGTLCEVGWYEQGKEHGRRQQYDTEGNMIGAYTMIHGTGLDLWFIESGVISEERSYVDGERHGYERWWIGDNTTISEESHFSHGVAHGIFRQWNRHGHLRRGYPRYFVAGQRVTKRQYGRACLRDPFLPRYNPDENMPTRRLPDEVTQPKDQQPP